MSGAKEDQEKKTFALVSSLEEQTGEQKLHTGEGKRENHQRIKEEQLCQRKKRKHQGDLGEGRADKK